MPAGKYATAAARQPEGHLLHLANPKSAGMPGSLDLGQVHDESADREIDQNDDKDHPVNQLRNGAIENPEPPEQLCQRQDDPLEYGCSQKESQQKHPRKGCYPGESAARLHNASPQACRMVVRQSTAFCTSFSVECFPPYRTPSKRLVNWRMAGPGIPACSSCTANSVGVTVAERARSRRLPTVALMRT